MVAYEATLTRMFPPKTTRGPDRGIRTPGSAFQLHELGQNLSVYAVYSRHG